MFYDFRESHICFIHDQLRNKIRSIKLTALFIQCVLENIYFTNYSLCNFKFRATARSIAKDLCHCLNVFLDFRKIIFLLNDVKHNF